VKSEEGLRAVATTRTIAEAKLVEAKLVETKRVSERSGFDDCAGEFDEADNPGDDSEPPPPM
jgi:hypothetical protein